MATPPLYLEKNWLVPGEDWEGQHNTTTEESEGMGEAIAKQLSLRQERPSFGNATSETKTSSGLKPETETW